MATPWFPPIDRRAIARFALIVVVLLAPWPRWGRAFGALFSAYGNALVSVMDTGDAAPHFGVPSPGEVSDADGGAWAVVLTSSDRAFPLDTRIIAYTPLAIFLALALATSAPGRRKVIVLGGGLVLIVARLTFAVVVPLHSAFAAGSPSALASFAQIVWTVLITPPVMSYATPLAIWWVAVALTTPRAESPPARRRRSGGRRRS